MLISFHGLITQPELLFSFLYADPVHRAVRATETNVTFFLFFQIAGDEDLSSSHDAFSLEKVLFTDTCEASWKMRSSFTFMYAWSTNKRMPVCHNIHSIRPLLLFCILPTLKIRFKWDSCLQLTWNQSTENSQKLTKLLKCMCLLSCKNNFA